MSEISEDLKRQMAERGNALLSNFLERKPGYDGPTLAPDEEARIKAQEAAKVRAEAILAHVRELGDDY
jgi:hypothetical protein